MLAQLNEKIDYLINKLTEAEKKAASEIKK